MSCPAQADPARRSAPERHRRQRARPPRTCRQSPRAYVTSSAREASLPPASMRAQQARPPERQRPCAPRSSCKNRFRRASRSHTWCKTYSGIPSQQTASVAIILSPQNATVLRNIGRRLRVPTKRVGPLPHHTHTGAQIGQRALVALGFAGVTQTARRSSALGPLTQNAHAQTPSAQNSLIGQDRLSALPALFCNYGNCYFIVVVTSS